MDVYENDSGTPECPFCSSVDCCDHVLLLVDSTFRTADGGALMDAFSERWGQICEDGGDGFDEREAFEILLEEVDAIAESSVEYDHEGGPGASSSYSVYYLDSAGKAEQAVAIFVNRDTK